MKTQRSKFDRHCDFCGGIIRKKEIYGITSRRKACKYCINTVKENWKNA
jgi:hypothetical protein